MSIRIQQEGTSSKAWHLVAGTGPIIATAIHDGHEVREEVEALLAIDAKARLREEDPYTREWATIASTHIVVRRSRFEVDLNRPRDRAVYVTAADAWGLDVWRSTPPADVINRSLALYDEFYAAAHRVLDTVRGAHGAFVVLDLHTYNHRRDGPNGSPADAAANPEVNIGTGSMDRARWGPLVDRFMNDLSQVEVQGRRLDVRENVKFQGGRWPRWIHETFPETGCSLAIEFKKFFMDEWTGEGHEESIGQITSALRSTLDGLNEELSRLQTPSRR